MADENGANASATDSGSASVDASPSPAPSPAPSSTPAEPPASSSTPAEPQASTHGDTQPKQTLLDAVLKAVPAATERDVLDDGAATPSPPGQPDVKDQADTTEPETENDTAEDDQLPQDAAPATRRKFNKLLKQRTELRKEIETLRRPAEVGMELENFAKQNNLPGDSVAEGLSIMAMLAAGDYASFYKAVGPYVRNAQEYLGIVLPRDLQESVRAGQMVEPVAKQMARQRFDGARANHELEATRQAVSQQRVQTTQADVQRAVSSYETRLSASDPDYKAKAPLVQQAVQAELYRRGGKISSVDEALQISTDAYAKVNQHLKSMQPTPRATQPRPNGATQTTSARPAPKTLMEAALQGLETARRAGG